MRSIIIHLLLYIHHLHKQISFLLLFIAKYIPLKQWAFDDSHSPKYMKLVLDRMPKIIKFEKQDYRFLIEVYKHKYNKSVKPIKRRNGKSVPTEISCPRCGAPHDYLYDNTGGRGQYLCSVCNQKFNIHNRASTSTIFKCPHCDHTLSHIKTRGEFYIHKCINQRCSYYIKNIRKLPKDLPDNEKYNYKLHYLFRESIKEFFKMNLHELPDFFTNFNFKKYTSYQVGLCLTYRVNLRLSLRQTSQALKDIHGIEMSHTMVANYANTVSNIIKPFIDHFDYNPSNSLAADETYIKIKGLKGYVWFIMDAVSRSILGYTVSDTRTFEPCLYTIRLAFDKYKVFPGKALKFIADGFTAYPLAKYFWDQEYNDPDHSFDVTPVIGLSNDDEVSERYRPFKQKIERLNRTYKSTYRITNGYGTGDGALSSLVLWVAYYNFLRPHKIHRWKRPLNLVPEFEKAQLMPDKWVTLIHLGQQEILKLQEEQSVS